MTDSRVHFLEMRTNLILIIGIIASSLFNFTANESQESWVIMPPATIMRIIENFESHRQAIIDGGISWSESTHGIDVAAVNELLMFSLVIILIGREMVKKPVGKSFTISYFLIFLLSFSLKLYMNNWSWKSFGVWIFFLFVSGLLVWQHMESIRKFFPRSPGKHV